ncbi:Retrovirus-related Pol polyprotein [Labeo rohita]|uniref:Gypsy retrotransposon integrase-like protein 1 n=1 Tax=Labeo rohita TaxID=84645 RepID=A0ABQ8MSB6_LABRO|nr:Retrovirus-related Pol polyprotein [Labeo rohita]
MSIDDDPTGRRARWILELDPLNWVIVHKDGHQHKNADALSRRPEESDMDVVEGSVKSALQVNVVSSDQTDINISCSPEVVDSAGDVTMEKSNNLEGMSPFNALSHSLSDIRVMQNVDPDIKTALSWVEHSQRPSRKNLQGASQCLQKLWTEFNRLFIINGLLCRSVHCPLTTSAHFSSERVWERARQFCYWPSMYRDIKGWCEQCKACQMRRSPVPAYRAPMGGSQSVRPFERVAMDILATCDFKRKPSAQTVAHCLFEDYVLLHGVPEALHSDQGRQFEAEVVQTLCHLLNIKKTRTTPYNPKSDGMIEHFNRTLIDQLAKKLLTYGGEWDDYVKHVAFAYNTTTHSSTRFTPFFLTHGREAQVLADVLLPTHALDSQMSVSLAEFVSSLLTRLNSAFGGAWMHSEAAHEHQKLCHDVGLRHRPYDVGAMVWLHNLVESRRKLAPNWKGPYKIVQVMDSCGELGLTYQIVNPFDAAEDYYSARNCGRTDGAWFDLRLTNQQKGAFRSAHTVSNASYLQPESLPLESDVSGGAECVSPQKELNALSDSQCSVKGTEPSYGIVMPCQQKEPTPMDCLLLLPLLLHGLLPVWWPFKEAYTKQPPRSIVLPGCSTLVLEIDCPAEFSSNPDQKHT